MEEDDVGGTYRAVYTVKFAEAVFVLHCFQKKSKCGIATPKEDRDIINARLKIAEAYVKELRKRKHDLLTALKCIVAPVTCLPTLASLMLKSSRSKLAWFSKSGKP